MYAKCEEMVPAKLLFEQIDQPDLVSYNAIILFISVTVGDDVYFVWNDVFALLFLLQ